jgi:hypothetical protein
MITVLLFAGAAILLFWGLMHISKTAPVVKTFGELSIDNKRILTMEWISEGMLLVFLGLLVTIVTLFEPHISLAYWLSASTLFVMAAVSLATGARTPQLPFKLCSPIFTTTAVLILLGSLL